ncbi:ATP synthase F1 subunit gamma [Patescibacteria group bacterium]|nr:MAG: ATP synthase F1 subunit gamma [Patescibacteria group bacterium]
MAAGTTAIKRRIRSVTSTRQITKAMQLVAASKLRAAANAAQSATVYRQQLNRVLAEAATTDDWRLHPLAQAPNPQAPALIVVFASDRGLAGAYLSRIESGLRQLVRQYTLAGTKVEVAAIGQQVEQMTNRLKQVEAISLYPGLTVSPDMRAVRGMAASLLDRYRLGEISSVMVLTTRFISSLNQQVATTELLPLTADSGTDGVESKPGDSGSLTLEPTAEEAITSVATGWAQAALLDAATNAVASEHAMRMLAMQNATDNASELIDELTLAYNTARQAAITQELAEISGGVAALTDA